MKFAKNLEKRLSFKGYCGRRRELILDRLDLHLWTMDEEDPIADFDKVSPWYPHTRVKVTIGTRTSFQMLLYVALCCTWEDIAYTNSTSKDIRYGSGWG
jgi:hypothetical protein